MGGNLEIENQFSQKQQWQQGGGGQGGYQAPGGMVIY